MKAWNLTAGALRDFSNAYYRCREFHPGTGTVDGFEEVRTAGNACAVEVLGMAAEVIKQAHAAAERLILSSLGPQDEDGEMHCDMLASLSLRHRAKVCRVSSALAKALENYRHAQAGLAEDRGRWNALSILIETLQTQGPVILHWVEASEAATRRNTIFLR